MTDTILSGKPVATEIKQQVASGVQQRIGRGKIAPGLAVVLVGDNPASEAYVGHKQRGCEQVGIVSTCHRLPADSTEQQITDTLEALNQDPTVHGILLQLPLPDVAMADRLLEKIDPDKDVDGFHPYNIGRLVQRQPLLRPCTPWGVMKLLQYYNVDCAGKNAVIIGASNIVGRPMALELLLAKATITVCHRFTKHLEQQVRSAEILVVGIGNPGIIKTEWINKDCVVIDVGFNRRDDGSICGDIDFDSAKHHAKAITPVPGGVGLMTVAMLLSNTLEAANRMDPAL
ncbi:MAG: bifunctional methylenetetrahydrofolate dehydrogenase/methenyltetrahydrofolate cyclohydrolase FolD [Coxiellaceae bacterium]|nr:bifunctional methylenetetrahydrofolate dehydrogenase/methenyltetrahydrofolate cyclohydrolase FolD [Coxiellaceae bacterium]